MKQYIDSQEHWEDSVNASHEHQKEMEREHQKQIEKQISKQPMQEESYISSNLPVSSSKICEECGGEMTVYEVPVEGVLFRIPFTEIDVMWRRWNGKDWWCEDCTRDGHNERGRDAYDAGIQEGYERAINEQRRGW